MEGCVSIVSVIIPTYNYARFLLESIHSVQAQSFTDWEIVVVDDGSTDETPDLLSSIEEPRLKCIRIPHTGTGGAARNAGLETARGEFIAFLDADDRWRPSKLLRQVELFRAEPEVGLVFTDLVRFRGTEFLPSTQFEYVPELTTFPSRPARHGDGVVITAGAFVTLASTAHFATWPSTVMVRASQVGHLRFLEDRAIGEDLHYMLQAYLSVTKAAFIPEPLAELRRHGDNLSNPQNVLAPVVRVLEMFRETKLSPAQRDILMAKLANALCALGYECFWQGRALEAGQAYARALQFPGRRGTALTHLALLPLAPWLASRTPRGTRW
jgi:glycosyltransferase involved in cell wall biosynthesis